MEQLNQATREKLKRTIARIERLEDEKAEVAQQIKDVYAEAKAFGFDVKVIRAIVELRKQDRDVREAFEQVLDVYLHALGEI